MHKMQYRHWGIFSGRVLVSVLVVITLIASWFVSNVPIAHADGRSVDLVAQLITPASAKTSEKFTWSFVIRNNGVDATSGATFEFIIPRGIVDAQVTCVDAVNGATCPTSLTAQPATVTQHGRVSGILDPMPAGSHTSPAVTFSVTGTYPVENSVGPMVEVFTVSGDVDENPASNRSVQQISLLLMGTLKVSKTQDKDIVASGETRTYTLTYDNVGDTDITTSISDTYLSAGFSGSEYGPNSQGVSMAGVKSSASWSVMCDASSTMECPNWIEASNINDAGYQHTIIPYRKITIPAGKKLVLKVPFVDNISCSPSDKPLEVENRAGAYDSSLPLTSGSKTNIFLYGGLTSPHKCTFATLKVTKTQDKDIVASGETRTYTVTYENTGTQELNFEIGDNYTATTQYGRVFSPATAPSGTPASLAGVEGNVKWSVMCDVSSTIACPQGVEVASRSTDSSVAKLFEGRTVSLPPSKKLVLKVPVVETISCAPTNEPLVVGNEAYYSSVSLSLSSDSVRTSQVYGGVVVNNRCATTTLKVSKTQDKDIVASGETRTYTVVYDNIGNHDVTVNLIDEYDTVREMRREYVGSHEWSNNTAGSFDGTSGSVTWSVSCDPSSTVTCDERFNIANKTSPYREVDIYNIPQVTIPAGRRLVLKIPVTEVLNQCPSQPYSALAMNNSARFRNPSISLTNESVTDSSINGGFRCVDLSTNVSVDNSVFTSAGRVNIVGELNNSGMTAVGNDGTGVPMVFYLPHKRFVPDLSVTDTSKVTCESIGDAVCPISGSWIFDPVEYTLSGKVAHIAPGAKVKVKIPGRIIAETTANGITDNVRLAAEDKFDINPGRDNRNMTEVNILTVNKRGPLTVDLVYRSGKTLRTPITVTGTLVCSLQSLNRQFEVTIPANVNGSARVTITPAEGIWDHDDCTVSLNDPPAVRTVTWHHYEYTDPAGNVAVSPQGVQDNVITPSHYHFSLDFDQDITDVDIPVELPIEDPCGPDNAFYPHIEDTQEIHWTFNADQTVTATAQFGYRFKDGTITHTYTKPVDSGEVCEVHPPTTPPTVPPTTVPPTSPPDNPDGGLVPPTPDNPNNPPTHGKNGGDHSRTLARTGVNLGELLITIVIMLFSASLCIAYIYSRSIKK